MKTIEIQAFSILVEGFSDFLVKTIEIQAFSILVEGNVVVFG